MFEKFTFTPKQIEKYFAGALKDFNITKNSGPEIVFTFCYNCLLKLAIAVCAKNNLRVKAKQGHHIALIEKMSEYLGDENIEVMAQEMRSKRNRDLYDGGILITKKEAEMYFEFTGRSIKEVEKYLNFNKLF